jgi:hypothetical protein
VRVLGDAGEELHAFCCREKVSGAVPLNANGVASFSPRLRGTSYLGSRHREDSSNLKGLQPSIWRVRLCSDWCNPFRVVKISWTISQGSSCLATLGYLLKSLEIKELPAASPGANA